MNRILAGFQAYGVVAVASIGGLLGFAFPLLIPAVADTSNRDAHAALAPLVFAGVAALCLLALLAELSGPTVGHAWRSPAKFVALLGVLVAIDATLRLVPTFLGASPIFALVILAGFVFGPVFGFVMGAMTLLVSAFMTGGVGPWLPYQMLGTGWIGLTAGWLPKPASERRQVVMLAVFGAGWGYLYGALLNLSVWPYAQPGIASSLTWEPGLTMTDTVDRYIRFYIVTSLTYDTFRAVANLAIILALGGPVLRVLERYRSRFAWTPWETVAEADAAK